LELKRKMELYDGFEGMLAGIGLGSPLARGTVGAVLFSLPIILHSSICYTEVRDGVYIPRPWSLLAPNDENATAFPWYIFPILGARIFGLVL
jgi:hypothetical protein